MGQYTRSRRSLYGWLALAGLACSVDDRRVDTATVEELGDPGAAGGQKMPARQGGDLGVAASSGEGDPMPSGLDGASGSAGAGDLGGSAGAGAAGPTGLECSGCSIEGDCVAAAAPGPNPCLVCDPARDAGDWSPNDGAECNDGRFCTVDDVCTQGVCGGAPRLCDDGVACNGESSCEEASGACTLLENLCGEGALCGSDGVCVNTCAGCVISGNCIDPGAEQPGAPCFICDPARSTTDYSVAVGQACGAGAVACSAQDTCDASGVCAPNHFAAGTACGDARSSTCDGRDTCDGSGSCSTRLSANGVACDDGQACTVGDSCRVGTCVSGAPRVCSGATPTCDPDTGDCVCVDGTERCSGTRVERCDGGRFVVLEECSQSCNPATTSCECLDDSDPNTALVQSARYGCGFAKAVPGDASGAWVTFESGLQIDRETGKGWFEPSGFVPLSELTQACSTLEVAGLSGWRVPTIDDIRELALGCAPTEPDGSCALSDPSCLSASCGDCGSCLGGQGPAEGAYCRPNVPCRIYHTASRCSDCTPPNLEWIYSPSNGNVANSNPTTRISSFCIRAAVPQ